MKAYLVLILCCLTFASLANAQEDVKKFDIAEFSKKLDLNKPPKVLMEMFKKKHPELAAKLDKTIIELKTELCSSHDVVYMFTSNSVSKKAMRDFVLEASLLNYYYGTKVKLVVQGFYTENFTKKLLEIKKELKEYKSGDFFVKNLDLVIDPMVFKELNIKQVPVIAYGTHKGDAYPDQADILFLSRGDTTLLHLFELVKEKDKIYEVYFNILTNSSVQH